MVASEKIILLAHRQHLARSIDAAVALQYFPHDASTSPYYLREMVEFDDVASLALDEVVVVKLDLALGRRLLVRGKGVLGVS